MGVAYEEVVKNSEKEKDDPSAGVVLDHRPLAR
jgi:hypothetical protein